MENNKNSDSVQSNQAVIISKEEIVSFIAFLKDTYQKENILKCYVPEQAEGFSNMVNIIKSSSNHEETYYILGDSMSAQSSSFENIGFREDCFDYLTNHAFEKNDALVLMEGIRKGLFNKPKFDDFRQRLENDFILWAEGVEYLASRSLVLDIFKEEYEKFKKLL